MDNITVIPNIITTITTKRNVDDPNISFVQLK